MSFADIAVAVDTDIKRTVLTAPLAVKLAEEALNAGQIDNAICYINMAYAIFDSDADRLNARLSASGRNTGRT